ncbi:MAG: DUF1080 domain-containing protein [Planctomycetes bacterium]|nr:DUF1080 domain-containing protein [Planctomycetota bacterium]
MQKVQRSLSLLAALVSAWPAAAAAQSPDVPSKTLPLAGEVFAVQGATAFLILPPKRTASVPVPWVWYAPTLPGLPGNAETWMFEKLTAAGIAIAGVDAGESYGSPAGRAIYSALYEELVERRGLARRAGMLARSRGGLMLYNWAAEHPERVRCIAGIYPVCDLKSWPGLARACGAYGLSETELGAVLSAHNPIERLAPLARASVPLFHLHGDSDTVVPLAPNSGELAKRYALLGGTMALRTFEGRGHDMWSGWFESQELVDFLVAHARVDGTTKGVIDIEAGRKPADAVVLVGPAGHVLIPENPDVESKWVFDEGVLTASPGWDSVITKEPYRDFRLHLEFNVNVSTSANPKARGNSGVYLQQRYELQILDSHGVPPESYDANDCGSIYQWKKPDRLANKPAGEWQSFDIAFRAARYAGEKKIEPARITAYQNGQLIHDDVEIPRKTGAGEAEGPEARPVKLQGHHNQVRFRNVWIQKLDLDR